MKNKIKSNLVLILFILGAAILFVGLLPLRAPIKDGRFTRSVVTDRNLSIRFGDQIQGTLLVSDEMTVKSYVKMQEFTRQRYPLVQVGFRIR